MKRQLSQDDSSSSAKRQKLFEKSPIITDSDFFTKMNNDCLLEVFSYLDLKNLGNLAVANQRLNSVSKKSILGRQVEKVGILQTDDDKYFISINHGSVPSEKDICHELSATGEERAIPIDKIQDQWLFPKDREGEDRPLPSFVIERISQIMRRIQPKAVQFKNIQVDDNSLSRFETIFHRVKHVDIRFYGVHFGATGKDVNTAKRFTKWVISTRPKKLTLWDTEIGSLNVVDADFIREISNVDFHPKVEINDFSFRHEFTDLLSNEEIEQCLSKFQSIKMDFLIVRAEVVMAIVLERFRVSQYGFWEFGTTRKLEKADIEAAMGTEYELEEAVVAEAVEAEETEAEDDDDDEKVEATRPQDETKYTIKDKQTGREMQIRVAFEKRVNNVLVNPCFYGYFPP